MQQYRIYDPKNPPRTFRGDHPEDYRIVFYCKVAKNRPLFCEHMELRKNKNTERYYTRALDVESCTIDGCENLVCDDCRDKRERCRNWGYCRIHQLTAMERNHSRDDGGLPKIRPLPQFNYIGNVLPWDEKSEEYNPNYPEMSLADEALILPEECQILFMEEIGGKRSIPPEGWWENGLNILEPRKLIQVVMKPQ